MIRIRTGFKRQTALLGVAALFAVGGLMWGVASRAATTTIAVESENGTVSNGAAVVNDAAASGAKAVVFGETMGVYYGSTHNHTGAFNNHGTDSSNNRDMFVTAKANGMDFLISTEHTGVSGPDSYPMDPQVFYADVKAQAKALTDSTFVGMAGYEFSDNDGGGGIDQGHMTAVETDRYMDATGTNVGALQLMDYLAAQRALGRPAFGGFNHPPVTGHVGSVASLLTAAHRNIIPMAELFNGYGSETDADDFTAFVLMLDRGWKIGPVCGLDGHGLAKLRDTFEPGPCRTGVLAPALTKNNLLDSIMSRKVFATRDLNLQMRYKANDQWMGKSIGPQTTVNFDIDITDPDTGNPADKITKVEIISDGGAVVASKLTNSHSVSWKPSVAATDKKYFFVRVFNGERVTYTATAAPVWLN